MWFCPLPHSVSPAHTFISDDRHGNDARQCPCWITLRLRQFHPVRSLSCKFGKAAKCPELARPRRDMHNALRQCRSDPETAPLAPHQVPDYVQIGHPCFQDTFVRNAIVPPVTDHGLQPCQAVEILQLAVLGVPFMQNKARSALLPLRLCFRLEQSAGCHSFLGLNRRF